MLKLHGSAVSNYYNKVKLALLEKGIPFEEVHCGTKSTDAAVLAASPLAKIPFLTTPQGSLCESQVILDWLEVTPEEERHLKDDRLRRGAPPARPRPQEAGTPGVRRGRDEPRRVRGPAARS